MIDYKIAAFFRPKRLRARRYEADRRRFLASWKSDVSHMSQAEIDIEISATKSAMRQIASLLRSEGEGTDV